MSNQPIITCQKLDEIFDEGKEDIIEYLDFSKARRPGLETNKISEKYLYKRFMINGKYKNQTENNKNTR